MKPTNQNTAPNIDGRYRTMLTLWFALFMSIVIYFGIALFMGPENNSDSDAAPNTLLTVVLTALGTVLVLVSFPVKRTFLERSVERQEVELVQKGLVFACAICEVSALLGLVERFVTNNRGYYLLFLISAIGIALHFPRREQLLSATYKTSWNGAAS
ncbi:MAG: hypothetical protein ND866_10685 [Pyrinomonadaceae bacterium]|nr:hypothetical protein [Pyrinomonadaceae bacterium]